VESYYAPGWTRDEKANLTGFEQGWRNVHEQFLEDPEAATFYALAHMATADPEDKSYSKQKRAAAISRQVLDQIPDHPGAHHYIIHANDYPPLAENAREVARSYGEIAPAVPHALHMPSHIFTRLGLWPQSIEMKNDPPTLPWSIRPAEKFRCTTHTHWTIWAMPTCSKLRISKRKKS